MRGDPSVELRHAVNCMRAIESKFAELHFDGVCDANASRMNRERGIQHTKIRIEI